MAIGQFADKPIRGQSVTDWSTCKLSNSQTGRFVDKTSQLAEMFYKNFRVINRSKFHFQTINVGKLLSPRVDQSKTWLTTSWFVGKLSGKQNNTMWMLTDVNSYWW